MCAEYMPKYLKRKNIYSATTLFSNVNTIVQHPPFSSLKCSIEGETRAWWRPLQAQPGIAQKKETRICPQRRISGDTKRTNVEPLSSWPLHLLSSPCWYKMVVKWRWIVVFFFKPSLQGFCWHCPNYIWITIFLENEMLLCWASCVCQISQFPNVLVH